MADVVNLHYEVDGENFTSAGEASVNVKKQLRQMGFPPEAVSYTHLHGGFVEARRAFLR